MSGRGRPKRVTCRKCGVHIDVCGWLSARGKCETCGILEAGVQQRAMHFHEGEYFQEWRRKVAASVGAIVWEDMNRENEPQ